MKKYIVAFIVGIVSLYLSFASFILIRILTNDIILNSYKAYSIAKIQTNALVDQASNLYDQWKLLINKFTNKQKAQQIEQELAQQEAQMLAQKQELQKQLEFNQKILSGLPYVLALIVFIFTYKKLYKEARDLLQMFENKNNSKEQA